MLVGDTMVDVAPLVATLPRPISEFGEPIAGALLPPPPPPLTTTTPPPPPPKDAATITTATDAAEAVVSALVATVNADAAYVPFVGFVRPPTVNDAAVFASSAHVPPKLASVTLITAPEPPAVAEQVENPAASATVAVPIVKLGWNVTEIVLAADSAPLGPEVNPTVQLEATAVVSGVPTNVTLPTPDVIVIAAGDSAAVLSLFVATVNPAAAYAPARGFVIPAIVSDATVFAV